MKRNAPEARASVTFSPTPNRLHTIEWSDTLQSESWQPLATGLHGPEPITVEDSTASERDRRFYRMRLEPSAGGASPPGH